MMRMILAAAAALALTACNQQGGQGPALPPVQQGAQAPATLTPQPGVQQAQITDDVRQQLITQIGQLLEQTQQQFASGMAPPAGFTDQIVPLQPGTDSRFSIDLTANTEYRFIGACDGDCTNIDIEVIDTRTGGVVASDMLPDDYPVVQFTPAANGSFIVRTLMQTCAVAPCYTGTRVLTQSAAGGGNK